MRKTLSQRVVLLVLATAAAALGCGEEPLEDLAFHLDVTWTDEIPTVATVAIQARTRDLLDARVEFGVDDEHIQQAPARIVDVGELRATLVGMKPDTDYQVTGFLTYPDRKLVSEVVTVTSGSEPVDHLALTVEIDPERALTEGYLVTSTVPGKPQILDADGDRVWWHEPQDPDAGVTTRVRLSRDGTSVLYLTWDSFSAAGSYSEARNIHRTTFDASECSSLAVPMAHHDFLELADGTLATLQFDLLPIEGSEIYGDRIVEIDPDGTETVVWRSWDSWDFDEDDVHENGTRWGHANALDHDEGSDSYYVSVLYFDTIFEIARGTGEVVRRLGGMASDYALALEDDSWFDGQHQFQVLPEGVLVFDNGVHGGFETRAVEYELDGDAWTASEVWSHAHEPPLGIYAYGDVSRIPGGNTLITWASAGQIQQVAPEGEVVWSVSSEIGAGFGYTNWVPSLYQD